MLLLTGNSNNSSSNHARQGSASSVDRALRPGGQNPLPFYAGDVISGSIASPNRHGPEWGRYDSDGEGERRQVVIATKAETKHTRQSSYLTAVDDLTSSADNDMRREANIGAYNINQAASACARQYASVNYAHPPPNLDFTDGSDVRSQDYARSNGYHTYQQQNHALPPTHVQQHSQQRQQVGVTSSSRPHSAQPQMSGVHARSGSTDDESSYIDTRAVERVLGLQGRQPRSGNYALVNVGRTPQPQQQQQQQQQQPQPLQQHQQQRYHQGHVTSQSHLVAPKAGDMTSSHSFEYLNASTASASTSRHDTSSNSLRHNTSSSSLTYNSDAHRQPSPQPPQRIHQNYQTQPNYSSTQPQQQTGYDISPHHSHPQLQHRFQHTHSQEPQPHQQPQPQQLPRSQQTSHQNLQNQQQKYLQQQQQQRSSSHQTEAHQPLSARYSSASTHAFAPEVTRSLTLAQRVRSKSEESVLIVEESVKPGKSHLIKDLVLLLVFAFSNYILLFSATVRDLVRQLNGQPTVAKRQTDIETTPTRPHPKSKPPTPQRTTSQLTYQDASSKPESVTSPLLTQAKGIELEHGRLKARHRTNNAGEFRRTSHPADDGDSDNAHDDTAWNA